MQIVGAGHFADTVIDRFRKYGVEIEVKKIANVNFDEDILAVADRPHFELFLGLQAAISANGSKSKLRCAYIDRSSVVIGPFEGGATPTCFECYFHRMRGNSRFRNEFDARYRNPALISTVASSSPMLSNSGAELLVQYLLSAQSVTDAVFPYFVIFEPLGSALNRRFVVPTPNCVSCLNEVELFKFNADKVSA
jgi:bacteriocin biosynthesis cyclodehydratase domain-containing protein